MKSNEFSMEDIKKDIKARKSRSLATSLKMASYHIREHPEDPDGYFKLADIQGELNLIDNKIQSLLKASQLEPDNPKANIRLGRIYLEQKRYDEAISHLKLAHELNEKSPVNTQILAQAYCSIGEAMLDKTLFEKGVRLLEHCVEMKNPIPRHRSVLALRYLSLGTFDWVQGRYETPRLEPTSKTHLETALIYLEKAKKLDVEAENVEQAVKETQVLINFGSGREFIGRITPGIIYLIFGFILLLSDPLGLLFLLIGIAYFISMRAPIYLINYQIHSDEELSIVDRIYSKITNLSKNMTNNGTSRWEAMTEYRRTRRNLQIFAILFVTLLLPMITIYGFYRNYFSQR